MQKLRIVFGILILSLAGGVLYLRLSGKPGAALQLRQSMGFSRDVTIIAHRGASHLAPEETAPAYLLARELGSDYLEIDLQRTKDGELIGLHDDTLERTTNAAEVFPGREKESAAAFDLDELEELDAGSWFNKAYPERARKSYVGLKIIRFKEFLKIAGANAKRQPGIYIETKSPETYPGIEKDLVEALRDGGWLEAGKAGSPPRVVLQSFSVDSLKILKELVPEVPRVLLISEEMAKKETFAALLENNRPLVQAIGPVGYLMWPWNTGRAHGLGLVVHAYTLNAGWQMRLADWFSVDGFFTDRSEVALEKFRRVTFDTEAMLTGLGYVK